MAKPESRTPQQAATTPAAPAAPDGQSEAAKATASPADAVRAAELAKVKQLALAYAAKAGEGFTVKVVDVDAGQQAGGKYKADRSQPCTHWYPL